MVDDERHAHPRRAAGRRRAVARAVGAHDRARLGGPVRLPTAQSRTPSVRGRTAARAQIDRFYDTFIGPRDITFHRDADVVVGVDRRPRPRTRGDDGATRLTMRIPAYLRYDLERTADDA